MPARKAPADRPRRGTADATRIRLVETAASVFNEVGYWGTDSNAIAHQAGYAPGTFYRHFVDKRAIFLAAYSQSVHSEWARLAKRVEGGGEGDLGLASMVVRFMVAHHRQWRFFRASARALGATDEVALAFFTQREKERLAFVRSLRKQLGRAPKAVEEDLWVLLSLERACDALADGEVASLGAKRDPVVKLALDLLHRHLAS